MDLGEETELADLADRNGEGGGDRLFGPVLRGEAFDGAPEVDGRHRRAHDVFAHRAHCVVFVRVLDQNVDLGKADVNRDARAALAIGDGERAVFLGDDRGLKDADGVDAGGEGGVRHLAGLDSSRIAGIVLQGSGIDAPEFHFHSPGFGSSRVFLDDETGEARAIRPGQRRRKAPGSDPA